MPLSSVQSLEAEQQAVVSLPQSPLAELSEQVRTYSPKSSPQQIEAATSPPMDHEPPQAVQYVDESSALKEVSKQSFVAQPFSWNMQLSVSVPHTPTQELVPQSSQLLAKSQWPSPSQKPWQRNCPSPSPYLLSPLPDEQA